MGLGNMTAERSGFARLNEENLTSGWQRVTGGDGTASFCVCPYLPDGGIPQLGGNIKLEMCFGDRVVDEFICTVVKNTEDLSQPFLFQSSHIGKAGIECAVGRNCWFRLKIEPNTGDDVVVGWVY